MKIYQKKTRGFALLETLLMLGILVVVTVLSVYTIYSKVSEARHISQNSNEIISISSAVKNMAALDPTRYIHDGNLKAYGALDMFIDGKTSDGHFIHGKTSDGHYVAWLYDASFHGVKFTIKGVSKSDEDRWRVVEANVKKHSPSITAHYQDEDITFIVPAHPVQ